MKFVRKEAFQKAMMIWTMLATLCWSLPTEALAGATASKAVYIDWNAVEETGPAEEIGVTKTAAQEDVAEEEESEEALTTADGRSLLPLGTFRLTGYCSCYSCSEGYGSMTATGRHAVAGRTIAVDPTVIPYGSHVLINGHEYIAEDCGGAIKQHRIDIYYNSHREASNMLQYAEVYLIM